jgi:putative Holliday junction resolvase
VTAMGLDYGERRIGVAVSDPGGQVARPLAVIERESRARDAARITDIVERLGVQVIVVGLPINMDGTHGPAARTATRFAGRLRRAVPAQVQLWDERLTTWEAEQRLIESGLPPERRRELRDAVAAAVLLQDYLDSHRSAT